MKQFSLLLPFIVVSFVGLKAQMSENQLQRKDATQLAGRLVAAMGISADIASQDVSPIEKALWSVANSDLPQAKMVSEQYQIHAFPRVNLSEVNVYGDPSTDWVKELQNGQRISHPELAEIIEKYELSAAITSNLDNIVAVQFTAPNPTNMLFVAQELSMIEAIILSEVPTPAHDGNDIIVKAVQGGWMLTYSLRFDKCEVGCRKEHSWQFGVKDSGQVVFVTEYGDEPPFVETNTGSNGWVEEEMPKR